LEIKYGKDEFDIVLIHPPYHRRSGSGIVFPLGLGYLASTARNAGFSVCILDCALYYSSLDNNTLKQFEVWLHEVLRQLNQI